MKRQGKRIIVRRGEKNAIYWFERSSKLDFHKSRPVDRLDEDKSIKRESFQQFGRPFPDFADSSCVGHSL